MERKKLYCKQVVFLYAELIIHFKKYKKDHVMYPKLIWKDTVIVLILLPVLLPQYTGETPQYYLWNCMKN